MPKQSNDDPQIQRFRETARSLGCDEDKEKFEATLGDIARHKPPPKSGKTTKKSKAAK
jgi:hypothetical protein